MQQGYFISLYWLKFCPVWFPFPFFHVNQTQEMTTEMYITSRLSEQKRFLPFVHMGWQWQGFCWVACHDGRTEPIAEMQKTNLKHIRKTNTRFSKQQTAIRTEEFEYFYSRDLTGIIAVMDTQLNHGLVRDLSQHCSESEVGCSHHRQSVDH